MELARSRGLSMPDAFNYIIGTGTIVPDAGQIQTVVFAEFKQIFGNDVDLSSDTPLGMLAQMITQERIAVADNNAKLANQINRNLAGGIYLDAIGQLFNVFRSTGSYTSVYATLTSDGSITIPAGSLAANSISQVQFQCVNTVVIPPEGTLTNVEFRSTTIGNIACDANTLTEIITEIPGWETINNPASAFLIGTLPASDIAFNNTISLAAARQGQGSLQAINAGLLTTIGVTSTNGGLQNNAATDQTIEGIAMVPNSIYFCIAGNALNSDIAATFNAKKGMGAQYNTGLGIPQSYTITDPISEQSTVVQWDKPSQQYISIKVTISTLSSLQDPTTSIQNAVLAYANGEVQYMQGFTVGAIVSPCQIAAAIAQQIPGISIQKVEVAINSFTQLGTTANTSTTISGLTYTDEIDIGMTVSGTGIPSATTVSSITDETHIVISNAATVSGTTILTFGESISYTTDPITIEQWQQAATVAGYITVVES